MNNPSAHHFHATHIIHASHIKGVDISRTRLAICRQVLIKYSIGRPCLPSKEVGEQQQPLWCRLLCTDGQSFPTGPDLAWRGSEEDIVFDSRAYDWQVNECPGQAGYGWLRAYASFFLHSCPSMVVVSLLFVYYEGNGRKRSKANE